MARKKSVNINNAIFADFSKGLYLLDTPRNYVEQLQSLAITGGRNIWSEKGALVAQHGYVVKDTIPDGEQIIGITQSTSGNNSFFIVTLTGKVYLYTAYEGLKEYKTTLEGGTSAILTRRDNDLIINIAGGNFIFGSYYEESSFVSIIENVTVSDYSTYYEFTIPAESIQYFWTGKELCVNDTDEIIITSIVESVDGTSYTIRAVSAGDHPTYADPVNIGEKTLKPITLQYKEKTTEEGVEPTTKNLTPLLFAVCSNRLFVEDVSGDIYYSQVGVIDGFEADLGAGYFGGFYNDTSKILSMEDFLDNVLIAKGNGLYILSIGDTVEIKKISQVGQEYATDHVIVGEKVYAFDTNSGTIVNAISINVFGSMVSGKPVISAEYIDAANSGINNTKRVLTYNAESEVFILYYGESLNYGLVLTNQGTLFPRELDKTISYFLGFNQGVVFITNTNEICQDFKKGTIIPNLSYVVNFEPIALRDNRLIVSTLLEITELNGINYDVTTRNAGISYQRVTPSFNASSDLKVLPPFLYSDKDYKYNSFENTSRWAEKKSAVTRIAAPMSGREGILISMEFPANTAFCLSALRLPDFSQGD